MVGSDIPQSAERQNHGHKAHGLSQHDLKPTIPTIVSRRIAMIIADGFDLDAFTAVRAAFKAHGAFTFVIGTRRSMIYPNGVEKDSGKGVMPDHHLEGTRSTLFDSVFIPSGAEAAITLRENGRAVHWLREAFGHLKAIGCLGEAVAFLQEAVVLPGVDLALDQNSKEVVTSYGVVTGWKADVDVLKSLKIEPSSTYFANAFANEVSKHRCYERELAGLVKKVAF
jgi:catalase